MKKVLKIFAILAIILCLYTFPSYADLGDFETYDSSWSSGDSWYSSDSSGWSLWDDDDDYWSRDRTYENGFFSEFRAVFYISFFIILLVFVFMFLTFGHLIKKGVMKSDIDNIKEKTQEDVINAIMQVDENFNSEEFTSWVKNLYIKMQYAWSDRDWSSMRYLETKELYEQHLRQIEKYKQEGQINKIENVSVNWVKFANFYQIGDNDVITVILNSKMIDYIVDEKTKNIIKGNNSENKINNYKLTFVRTTGVKTSTKTTNYDVSNCPNCGAPMEITSSGKCSYCGSVIAIGKHDWCLSSLEKYNGNI